MLYNHNEWIMGHNEDEKISMTLINMYLYLLLS